MRATRSFLGHAVALAAIVATLAAPSISEASDHADGVKTGLDRAADITDLYSFTSPRDPQKLVLIMNVTPFATSSSRFSDAVDYTFRIRPIEDEKTLAPSKDSKMERSIVCSFAGSSGAERATCKFDLGKAIEPMSFATRGAGYRAGGSAERDGIKIFAGVRSDPWFLDLGKTTEYVTGRLPSSRGGFNGLVNKNVLSIAVELDKSLVGGPLLAVTAQTVRK